MTPDQWVTSAIGGVGAIWAALATYRKASSDGRIGSKAQAADEWSSLLGHLQTELTALRTRIGEVEDDLEESRRAHTAQMADIQRELDLERRWNRALEDHIYQGKPPPPPARPVS